MPGPGGKDDRGEKEDLIKTAFRYMKPYDAVLREFEFVDLQLKLSSGQLFCPDEEASNGHHNLPGL